MFKKLEIELRNLSMTVRKLDPNGGEVATNVAEVTQVGETNGCEDDSAK